jgi:putative transposase
MSGVELKEQTMREDHIHIVLVIPPKYAVADVVGRLKKKTASALRNKFNWLADVYWKENVVWSPGYFATTFGIDESIVLNYVRHQADQDSGQASLDLS